LDSQSLAKVCRVRRGFVAGLPGTPAQHPVQARPVERPAVPQPQPDEGRVCQPVAAPRSQVGGDGPCGGRGDEDHAPRLLGPGALERHDPDEPLADQVQRQVRHPHLGDLGAPQALRQHPDQRVVTDVLKGLAAAAAGHRDSLIIIVRSCPGDTRPFGWCAGKDGSAAGARRSGDLRGLPAEAGEAADRDMVRSLLGEPCVMS